MTLRRSLLIGLMSLGDQGLHPFVNGKEFRVGLDRLYLLAGRIAPGERQVMHGDHAAGARRHHDEAGRQEDRFVDAVRDHEEGAAGPQPDRPIATTNSPARIASETGSRTRPVSLSRLPDRRAAYGVGFEERLRPVLRAHRGAATCLTNSAVTLEA